MVCRLFHFLSQFSLHLRRATEQSLDGAKLLNEFHSSLLTYARTSLIVIRRVAHQSQQVYHLVGIVYAIFLAHLLRSHIVIASAVTWTTHVYLLGYQLSIVLIGCKHIHLQTFSLSHSRHSAYHVIGLKTIHL